MLVASISHLYCQSRNNSIRQQPHQPPGRHIKGPPIIELQLLGEPFYHSTSHIALLLALPSFLDSSPDVELGHQKLAYPILLACLRQNSLSHAFTHSQNDRRPPANTTRWMSRRVMPEPPPPPALHLPASPAGDAQAPQLAIDDGTPTPLHSGNTQLLPAGAGRRRSSAGGAAPHAQHISRTQHDQYVSAFASDVKRRSPFETWPREALVDVLVSLLLVWCVRVCRQLRPFLVHCPHSSARPCPHHHSPPFLLVSSPRPSTDSTQHRTAPRSRAHT